MASRLIGAKPLPEPMLLYCQLDPKEHMSAKCCLISKVFIHEIAFENTVSEMAVVLSGPQCDNLIGLLRSEARMSFTAYLLYRVPSE